MTGIAKTTYINCKWFGSDTRFKLAETIAIQLLQLAIRIEIYVCNIAYNNYRELTQGAISTLPAILRDMLHRISEALKSIAGKLNNFQREYTLFTRGREVTSLGLASVSFFYSGRKAPNLGFGSVLFYVFCVVVVTRAQTDFAKRMRVL